MDNKNCMCTCTDTKCPNHPTNHDKGCSLCIEKCLKLDEIPSCFFHKTNKPKKGAGYKFEDFAKTVLGD